MTEEAPLQRTLKVGKATVGLIGLDVALNRVLADESLDDEAAAAAVFAAVKEQNYVPESAAAAYLDAIHAEIERLRHGKEARRAGMEIRILGPGCVSCNNLQKLVIEIMARMGVAADVFQVHDLDEIGRFGVMQTPALVINGRLVCSGRLPTPAQVEAWLREALAHG